MSQRIGYAFPGACVCAVVLFAPVGGPGGDAPLHAWLARAATGFSAGEPRAAAAARPARPLRTRGPGAMSFLKFAYLAPSVGGRALPRRAYLGPNLFPGGPGDDERTLPRADARSSARGALMGVYPRSWLKVGAGIGRAIQHAVPEGHAVAVAGRVDIDHWFGVAGTLFERLNGRGPFARVIDPTVDLVAADDRRRARAPWEIFRDVVMDRLDDEFILRGSGASDLSDRAEALAAALPREGQAGYMGAPVAVLVLAAPPSATVTLVACHSNGECDETALGPTPTAAFDVVAAELRRGRDGRLQRARTSPSRSF
ncbi:hypothetical protein JL720_514 [Aureococcus anophagefferens]|nr:hypothetical protein JL720_514 [Aureococcus anophagefferens]